MQTRHGVLAAVASLSFALAQEPQDAAATTAPKKPDKPFALMVGDQAPALAVGEWVKGDAVESFAKDKVTVVEFWATWCGPCIAGMPHLSEVQAKYQDQGVRVLGINIWDEPGNVAPFLQKEVAMHQKTGDECMQYTVGIEQKDKADDQRNGVMSRTWMQAAGRDGIPCAFVVDQQGRVAWIGHPSGVDAPLEQIVAGKWDLAKQSAAYAEQVASKAVIARYRKLFEAGSYDEAYPIGRKLVAGALADDAMQLNDLAWRIVDPQAPPAKKDLDLALQAAARANELTKSANPAILDTLAAVHFERKDLAKALEFQRLAAQHSKDTPYEEEIGDRLRQYEKLQAEKAAKEAAGRQGEAQKSGGGEKKSG